MSDAEHVFFSIFNQFWNNFLKFHLFLWDRLNGQFKNIPIVYGHSGDYRFFFGLFIINIHKLTQFQEIDSCQTFVPFDYHRLGRFKKITDIDVAEMTQVNVLKHQFVCICMAI